MTIEFISGIWLYTLDNNICVELLYLTQFAGFLFVVEKKIDY